MGNPVDLVDGLESGRGPWSTVDFVSLLVAEGDDIYAVLERWDPPHSTKGDDSRSVGSDMAVAHIDCVFLDPYARASGEATTLAAASAAEVLSYRFQQFLKGMNRLAAREGPRRFSRVRASTCFFRYLTNETNVWRMRRRDGCG